MAERMRERDSVTALDWRKVFADGKELSERQLSRFQQVALHSMGSVKVLSEQLAEQNIYISNEAVLGTFHLLTEVIYDMMEAGSIDAPPPHLVPILGLEKDGVVGCFLNHRDYGPAVMYDSEMMGRASSEMEEMVIRGFKVEKNTGDLAKVVYMTAHEVGGHMRQVQKLPYFMNGQALGYASAVKEPTENLMLYHTALAEANANAVAIRYLRVKKEARQSSLLWRSLDFSQINGEVIENQGEYKMMANVLKLVYLYKQISETQDPHVIERLRWKSERLKNRLWTADARMNKALERVGGGF